VIYLLFEETLAVFTTPVWRCA